VFEQIMIQCCVCLEEGLQCWIICGSEQACCQPLMWLVKKKLCCLGGSVVEDRVLFSCVGVFVRNKKWSICDVVSVNSLIFDPAEYVLFL
jgi:hypothetical protein